MFEADLRFWRIVSAICGKRRNKNMDTYTLADEAIESFKKGCRKMARGEMVRFMEEHRVLGI